MFAKACFVVSGFEIWFEIWSLRIQDFGVRDSIQDLRFGLKIWISSEENIWDFRVSFDLRFAHHCNNAPSATCVSRTWRDDVTRWRNFRLASSQAPLECRLVYQTRRAVVSRDAEGRHCADYDGHRTDEHDYGTLGILVEGGWSSGRSDGEEEEEEIISSRQVQYRHTKCIQTPNIYNCLPEVAIELL